MRVSDVTDFLLLAALWGGSFLFMRLAAEPFGPLTLMLLRCAIGAATLLPILLVSGRFHQLRPVFKTAGFVGIINSAIPFVLLAVAALSLTTGSLSVLNATAPFWGAIIAYYWLGEHLDRWQIAGMVIGFCGVMLLVAGGPADVGVGGVTLALAMIAALAATLAYGAAASFAKRYLASENALANATGSQIGAAAVLAVPGIWMWPDQNPDATAWLAIVLLGVFSTGFAYILYFRLIKNIGPNRAITVTFAIPVFGMFFGWLVLDESVGVTMLVGSAVVVLGCALTTKVLRRGMFKARA